MISKNILLTAFVSIFFICSATTTKEPLSTGCQFQKMVKDCKKELDPFTYGNSRTIMAPGKRSSSIDLTIFKGERYRLVFNLSNLDDEAVIKVYDGPDSDKRRDLLFTTADIPSSQDMAVFDPEVGTGELSIEYTIGSSDEKVSCFSFVLGYDLTFTGE